VARADEKSIIYVARLRCKMWSCDYCATQNRLIWRAHMIDVINRLGGVWSFLTVTAHPNAHKAAKSLLNLRQGLDKLMKRLRRKYGDFEYIRVYERHKSGQFHAHIIARINDESDKDAKKWLKANSAECGMGHQADFQTIRVRDDATAGGLVAAYVCKYLTKDAQNLGDMPKNLRRIQTSRGIGVPRNPESDKDWKYAPKGVSWQDRAAVLDLYDVSTGEHIGMDWFNNAAYYPSMKEVGDE